MLARAACLLIVALVGAAVIAAPASALGLAPIASTSAIYVYDAPDASTTQPTNARTDAKLARLDPRTVPRPSTSSVTSGRAAKAGRAGLDDLAGAAGASSRGGQTAAGRAVQKHGDRPGSIYPQVGSPDERSRIGQELVEDYLTHPQARERVRRGGIDIFELPGGRGVSFNADDTFRGFLETRP